jgi:hypothetical protein
MSRARYAPLLERRLEHQFVFSRHEARFLASAFEAAYPTFHHRFEPATHVPRNTATNRQPLSPRSQARGA